MDSTGDLKGQRFLRPSHGEPRRRPAGLWPTGPTSTRLMLAVGATGLLLAAAIFGSRWLHATPRLAVRSVEFSGAERTTKQALNSVAAELRGRNLLALDLGRIEKRLLATSPWIKAASARRLLPGRLEISLLERRAIARLDGGVLLLADGGIALSATPTLTGDDSLPLAYVATGEQETVSLKRSSELLTTLHAGVDPLLPRLAAVDARNPDNIAIVLRNHTYAIHLGHSDFASGLNRFRNAESVIAARYQGLETVDVRYRGRVVVAPVAVAVKGPAAPAS